MYIKQLSSLFQKFPITHSPEYGSDPLISFVTADSRKVKPGSLFIATSGESVDGHEYIESAIENGAVAIVGEKPIHEIKIPYIRVENSRKSIAFLAAALYDYPAHKLTMIGVTGTDGKTTTSNIIYQILLAAGYKTGMITTVNAVIGSDVVDTGFHVTTPDAPEVQFYLAKMVENGLSHVILETTSHGWAQYRVDACEFDIGVITNISHEHLDYHGTFENYRAAKARLFSSLVAIHEKNNGTLPLGVLNQEDASFEYLHSISGKRFVSYGLSPSADVYADNISQALDGIQFTVNVNDYSFTVRSKLYGTYNISNCLAALTATILGLGIDPKFAIQGINNLAGVPGRMERIELGQKFSAFVDFAHTPNALKVALETSRLLLATSSQVGKNSGKVIVVFGSAGLRDKEKRRLMAEVSYRCADLSIFTAEDPRTESLDAILEEMAQGAKSLGAVEGQSFWRIGDRGDAIRKAVQLARPGDLVIACGKGHEQSMCFGTIEYPWDDCIAMKAALSEYLEVSGPVMPYLPTLSKIEPK